MFALAQIKRQSLPPNALLVALIVIVAAVVPLWVNQGKMLANDGPYDSFLRNVRTSRVMLAVEGGFTPGGFGFGLLSYAFPVSVFATLGLLVRHVTCRRSRNLFVFSLLLSVILAVLGTGRGDLFFILTPVFGIMFVLRRMRLFRIIFVYAILGAVVFILLGLVMQKAGSFGQPASEVIQDIKMSFITYITGPVVALDKLLNTPQELALGRYSFRFFCIIGTMFGFDIEITSLVREFRFVPFPTNVYTVADPYYRDFGFLGVLIAQFLFGAFHGFLYRRATMSRPSAASIMLYALSLYPLVFQFFQDQYLSLTSTWLQYILLFLIAWFIRSAKVTLLRKRRLTFSVTGRYR
jgi:oligosaccharide repeat unit polymerase